MFFTANTPEATMQLTTPTSIEVFVAIHEPSYEWDCVFPNHRDSKQIDVPDLQLLVPASLIQRHYRSFEQWELVQLDDRHPDIRRAIELLSVEQFSPTMYHHDYFNGEKTVNFPLSAEKLATFSQFKGMQLLGVLDTSNKLCGFACYFTNEWPSFAGELRAEADRFAENNSPKTYLYLVLLRPNTKGHGLFAAIYDVVEEESINVGRVGCALEIHQINARSLAAHTKEGIGFKYMGTRAVHERTDASGRIFPLLYRQYYRGYDGL